MNQWHALITDWRDYLTAAGRPPTTIKLRLYQMRRFAEHHPVDASAQAMTSWLAGSGWSVETRKSFRAGLRSFYRWAHLHGHVGVDESALLPPVRSIAHPPRPCPESAVAAALLRADARTGLMVRLASRLGLRRGEIARIHADDVWPDLVGWS